MVGEQMPRSSGYSDEVADAICERIADGESLRAICASEDMPSQSMVYRWLKAEENGAFREQYAHAREAQADAMAEDILSIADGTGEDVQRDRLRVDARKWLASKMAPKKYGDKLELSGDPQRPVHHEVRFTIVDPQHSDR